MVALSVYVTASLVVILAIVLGELYVFTLDKETRARNLRVQFLCFLECVILIMSVIVWRTFVSRRSVRQDSNYASGGADSKDVGQLQRRRRDQNIRSKLENENTYLSLALRIFLLCYLGSCHLAFACNIFLMAENPHWLSMLTYATFGSLIQLVTALFTVEAIHYLLKLFSKKKKLFIISSRRWRHVIVVVYTVFISVLGLYRAVQLPTVKTVNINISKLPKSLEGFRIVQLTDIHLGPTVGRSRLEAVVEIVNGLKPDIVVMTGDLVDGSVQKLKTAVEPMRDIKSIHGKYFIAGNHEYYTGDVENWYNHMKVLGYNVLHNTNIKLPRAGVKAAQQFCLAGVDDIDAVHLGYHGHGPDIDAALSSCDPTQPVVVLAHQPRVAKTILDSSYRVDLILSGHTHGGQMFPMMIGAYLINPFFAGLYHYQGRSYVYVSEGTVYWGIPMRIGSSMEITEVILTNR
ncbi:transmembrane protein with metallophosphoesterase domain-like [Argonauta hians]